MSGVTVAVALASLMLFPEMFLRSMGYGGVATVLVDMLAALTVLPALLAVLGPRVNALRIRRAAARPARGEQTAAPGTGIARSVMRRPVAYVAVIVVALLALGRPVPARSPGAAPTPGRCPPAPRPGWWPRRSPGLPRQPDHPDRGASSRLGGPVTAPAQRAALAAYQQPPGTRPGCLGGRRSPGVRGDIARVDLRFSRQIADPRQRRGSW